MQKSKDVSNPATNSNKNEIVLYDEAFSKNKNLSRIFAHEFAHQLYGKMTEFEKLDYRRGTGAILDYKENGDIDWIGRENGYIEPDGRSSFEEDFANNLEHFIYNSDKLKTITPGAYNWFNKKYGTKPKN